MFKCLVSFLFVFFTLSSFSFAKIDEAKLKKEYGQDLTQAPFFLRFAFSKKFNKDWKASDYHERKVFLADYETGLAAQQVQEKAEAKAEAQKEKELLHEKKEADLQEKERLKEDAQEEKAQEEDDAQRQKDFNAGVTEQEKELSQMQRLATQGN